LSIQFPNGFISIYWQIAIKAYRKEFKRDAIRLQETSGKSIGTIEKELGLSHNLLRQWKQRYQVNAETDELERSEIEQLKAELRQAKRKLEIVRQERDILKNSAYLLERHAVMTYGCVKTCAAEFPIARVCEVLNVSESGSYAWLKRTPSQREQSNQTLKAQIVAIGEQFKHCYGTPHVFMLNYKLKDCKWASIVSPT
jgi:transposase-like protein